MNPSEIRKELQSGVSIAEVCTKYDLTFKDLCHMFHGYVQKRRKLDLPMYICLRSDEKGYMIRRRVNGKVKYFGCYDTIDDAIKVRDYLIKHGWYQKRVPRIREELGV